MMVILLQISSSDVNMDIFILQIDQNVSLFFNDFRYDIATFRNRSCLFKKNMDTR